MLGNVEVRFMLLSDESTTSKSGRKRMSWGNAPYKWVPPRSRTLREVDKFVGKIEEMSTLLSFSTLSWVKFCSSNWNTSFSSLIGSSERSSETSLYRRDISEGTIPENLVLERLRCIKPFAKKLYKYLNFISILKCVPKHSLRNDNNRRGRRVYSLSPNTLN